MAVILTLYSGGLLCLCAGVCGMKQVYLVSQDSNYCHMQWFTMYTIITRSKRDNGVPHMCGSVVTLFWRKYAPITAITTCGALSVSNTFNAGSSQNAHIASSIISLSHARTMHASKMWVFQGQELEDSAKAWVVERKSEESAAPSRLSNFVQNWRMLLLFVECIMTYFALSFGWCVS